MINASSVRVAPRRMPRSSCSSPSALGLCLCSHEPTSEASHSPVKTATDINKGCCISIRYGADFLNVPLRRRVAALKRRSSSSVALAFSSSCMVFDRFGASLLRNLSSTLPTESLLISAIVNSSALGKSTTAATSNQFDIARIDINQRHVVFALVRRLFWHFSDLTRCPTRVRNAQG